jgi:potassium efflux system protein
MHPMQQLSNANLGKLMKGIKVIKIIIAAVMLCAFALSSYAKQDDVKPLHAPESITSMTIDRVQLVVQQINLLKNRLLQSELELNELQQQQEKKTIHWTIETVNKSVLDKAALDIAVSKSNLDSVNIELTDTHQTIVWLEKSIQEIKNQINVLGVFGARVAQSETNNLQALHKDSVYQENLLQLEKKRYQFLKDLQTVASNVLALRTEKHNQLNALLKSQNLLYVKQQQIKDELVYQEQQNEWLHKLNGYYARLSTLDPVKSKQAYAALERDIYLANENANYAYTQSLIARYDDQVQQMNLAVLHSSTISVLNEISDQYQVLNKQIDKLSDVLNLRINVLDSHVARLTLRKKDVAVFQPYIKNLSNIAKDYQAARASLNRVKKNASELRLGLDHALQVELSARQGFPAFGWKTFIEVGKEILLVPALSFQIAKSISGSLIKSFEATSLLAWCFYALLEAAVLFVYFFLRGIIRHLLERPSKWQDKINSKWLSLQWLRRNLIDLFVIANLTGLMAIFDVPRQQYSLMVYLAIVWVAVKGINTIARLCLVETTHDSSGDDAKLYHHLKWVIFVGGIVTALTVFVHQLPLIYELKALCDRLFLLLLMVVSLFLLRSYAVVPNLILSHMETNHPYLRKSITLIGILVPLLLLGNSIIGVFGYLNLIMTVSWYEGLFLIVLIGYLILRGLLSDGMEVLSALMIQYVKNGWLWTEAFLKPLDKILRISLFLMAWAVLFILYGWDKQSPMVETLTWLLNYQLVHALHTRITPLSILEVLVVISVFYWTAKWTREFVYRLLLSRTKDMGIRNSIAILSQYTVIVLGALFCLRVLGIDLSALAFIASMFAFGVGLGLRDLANNFACGFLILLERPLRVGDIVSISGVEGEVAHIGGRAVTVRTWDHMELVVPNAEIFNKSFTNWTSKDNIVRTIVPIIIGRHDNPHEVKVIIQNVLAEHSDVLKDPVAEVYLKEINDTLMQFELRYYVNIRQVKSRTSVASNVLMQLWDAFAAQGIKPPYPQQEIFLRSETTPIDNVARMLENRA